MLNELWPMNDAESGNETHIPYFLFFNAGLFLVAAFVPVPYGFYGALRIATFVIGVVGGYYLLVGRHPILATGLFVAALIFNPISPLRYHRDVWLLIDLVAAGYYIVAAVWLWSPKTEQPVP